MNICFISLGCDKNLVDTERMMALAVKAGFGLTGEASQAEIIVVNTCCFIDPAKEESIDTILEMAAWKESGICRRLIVCGCMAERYREEVLKEFPEVDAVIGTFSWDRIAECLKDCLAEKGGSRPCIIDSMEREPERKERILSTGGHFAYLKIAEGCDKHCTYCVIPSVRGSYRSVPEEELLKEAEELASQGVKELILVAQETTRYGTDLYGEKRLPQLLHRLCGIEDLHWIRMQYCYPEEITPELIRTISSEKKICRYLDIPIQHASDTVLRRMGRRTNQEDLRRIVADLRREIPDIALRTTLITGFPGETDEDFRILKDFVREMRFDRLGVFAYSREEGTPAASMKDQIEDSVREARRDELMALQQDISRSLSEAWIGRTMEVMIEGRLPEEDVWIGRTFRDSPDVDGYLFLSYSGELMTGDFVSAVVTSADAYDLTGEVR